MSTGHELVQIASDGGLLPAPVAVKSVELFVAERAEVVIDFSRYQPGTQIILRNVADPNPLTQPVMRFDVVGTAPDNSQIPGTLCPLPPADKPVAERTSS
ncbi:MAG TPA: hypothetical protein VFO16_18420 [Pseudonocardiaceae bacterium]|nr:hypothetical protein [Pseudonocardiaceae bacterium]